MRRTVSNKIILIKDQAKEFSNRSLSATITVRNNGSLRIGTARSIKVISIASETEEPLTDINIEPAV
jgi:hypothetical protein